MSSTESQVYVLIATDNVSEKINSLIDAGYFSEAKDLDYQLESLDEKVKSLILEQGGQLLLSTYERHVLLLPLNIAENLPLLLEGYKNHFGQNMQVGIGLNLAEAKKACDLAEHTGNIEMYDPEQQEYIEMQKNDNLDISSDLFELEPQPNVFDRQHPPSPEPEAKKKIGQYIKGPDAQTAIQLESQIIQATVQQLNGPAQQAQQQAQQQMQQMQQQQQQQQPNNLAEALSGEKQKESPKKTDKEKNEDSDKEKIGEKAVKESEEKTKEDEKDSRESEKLASLLEMVNEKIPKLTDLADKNPEAFKKVIGLVHKIVDMAKDKKKDLDKGEISDVTEELNKAIKMFYPVGTVKNGKKKVLKDGKASWRSVRSGMIKDAEGNAISVESHNSNAESGKAGTRQ